MLGPQMCWQLLLAWALLVAQPVFGDSGSDSIEPPPSEEPAVPVFGELEDPVPEAEEPLPVLEEPQGRFAVPEEREEQGEPPSDEELAEREQAEREWLEQEKEKPCGSWVQYLQQIALGHYNKHSYRYYKLHGKANLSTKKAIGTMVHLKMMLVKTNCTMEQQPETRDTSMFMMYHESEYPKCDPLDHSEQECSFTFFLNKRERYWDTTPLLHNECTPIRLEEKTF